MGRLANTSGKEAVKAFEKAGWRVAGQVGSHVVMIKTGIRANLSVPPSTENSRSGHFALSSATRGSPWTNS